MGRGELKDLFILQVTGVQVKIITVHLGCLPASVVCNVVGFRDT